ncbi:MAG TPA: hypothetical protein VFZ80_02720 [Acidimicrobiia bacterium]
MTTDPGLPGHRLLERCEACGVDFDHDVARCPECGERTAIGRRRAITVAIAIVVTLVVLAGLWAAVVLPSSPITT